jgi:hypothetical protein
MGRRVEERLARRPALAADLRRLESREEALALFVREP